MTNTNLLTAARAEALFNSDLPMGKPATTAQVASAIRDSVRRLGGARACAAEVAAAYGDCPEAAVLRMRWALRVVTAAYRSGASPTPRGDPDEPIGTRKESGRWITR
jgi:hypothetical protein